MSEFHPGGPFAPPKKITDPGYWDEVRKNQKRIADYSGFGLFLLPIAMPLLVATTSPVLYPLSAAATFAALFAGDKIAQALGFASGETPRYMLALVPAVIVLWFATRWDTWAGQNKIYWIARHVARNVLFVGFTLTMLATQDEEKRGQSPGQILNAYWREDVLYVIAGILVVFNFVLIRNSMAKVLWRTALKYAWLRPRDMAD